MWPLRPPPSSTPFPYTTLFRSAKIRSNGDSLGPIDGHHDVAEVQALGNELEEGTPRSPALQKRDVKLWPCDRHDDRSEEHTSELQSRENLVCRLLLEKKKTYRE